MKYESIGGSQDAISLADFDSPERLRQIKSADDLKVLKPIEQLKYLSFSIEAAEADSWYAYSNAFGIFEKMEKSELFSPLIRIVAEYGRRQLDANDELYYYNRPVDYEDFGYSSIVGSERIIVDFLTPEKEKMNEEEIRSELARLKKEFKSIGGYESGTEEDFAAQDLFNRQYALEYALEKLYFERNQARLREEFPFLPHDEQLVKIASDAAAVVKFQQKYDSEDDHFSFGISLGQIADRYGNIAIGPSGRDFDLDEDTVACLMAIHSNNMVKEIVEAKLDIDLAKIPLRAQAHLLKFMTEADNGRFDQLCNALHGIENEKLRGALLENFVAADFGEDYGDALLSIAGSERLSSKEKEKFFDTISSCRESIRKITELYSGINDGQFMREYARAANERLTDATMVFRQIAEKGVAGANLDWAGAPKFDFDSAMEALDYEMESLGIISGTLSDVEAGEKGAFAEIVMHPDSDSQRLQRTVYNFYSPRHGFVLLYTRPEGSHSFDPMVEYGKIRSRYSANSANAGVEASISLIANPVDPFLLPSPFKPDFRATNNLRFYDPSTMNKVSAIRLDREGRAPGASADDPNRDPINPVGMVSVDLAAIGDRADTPSGKIARLLSVGGKLREEVSGVNSSLNHNTNWFSQNRYGTASGFQKLVEHIDAMANHWCAEHKPKVDQESFSRRMRQASQARGRKTMRAA